MSAPADPRAVLAAPGSTLSALLRAVEAVEQEPQDRAARIGVSSAVTVDLLGTYLRRHGLLAGTAVQVVPGNHDDPIGDAERFRSEGVRHMVLLPFFDALLPAFEAQLPGLAPAAVDALEASVRTRYRLALEAARPLSSVHLVTFHRLGSPLPADGQDVVAAVLTRFNAALREVAAGFANTRLVDGEDVVRTVGRDAAFDLRFWFRGKAPYTGAFLDELARRITVAARGFGAPFRKVLALDCDGTLWGGVVGEDSLAGIALGPHDHPGNVYWQVQHQLAALRRAGVLLCLVSKNNPADVDEVFRDHPDTVLRDEDFVLKKVDWSDKPAHVRALADELGLGLDSIVFLDDSPFECEAMRQQLPMVTTVQVPARLSDYPQVVRAVGELFVAGGATEESRGKTEQYRQRARAQQLQAASVDQQAYLTSLQLTLEVHRDDPADAARISELSQKSNQFNLTTRRYGVGDVEGLIASPEHTVYGLVVGDVFGSAGLTGAVVVHRDGATAHVESFFLSCRVLGRGLETAVWPQVVADAVAGGCTSLHAEFRPTPKNAQVSDFWDRLGLRLTAEAADGARSYCIAVDDFHTPTPAWIEMNCVG